MFKIHHIAISVSDIEKSLSFYKQFGFEEFRSWEANDKTLTIKHLKLNDFVLEIFCFSNSTADEPTKDRELEIRGVKHFALEVDNLEQTRQWILENKISTEITEIKHGRTGIDYFFIKDPDGIWIELVKE